MGVGHIQTADEVKSHLDVYDTGIHYADYFVGKLIQDLKDLDIYDQTAIIIYADHGGNQGELNVWGDHQTADYITNWIPLIVRWPGLSDSTDGSKRDSLHENLDVTATLAELLGAEQPSTWDGQSFAGELSEKTNHGRDFVILSQGAWSCQRSIR